MKKVSDAQKKAQKKYDAKTKTVAKKYTPVKMNEYETKIKYTTKHGISVNKLIKGLIREYLTNN